ncbi:unnamed protein product [Orchesella dallaii]|uniref:Uncharacterized protein n=1 Tax=Orchesella dallaii TaxID=48710 RepID=A0ABP1S7F3_9HEXA
MHWINPCMSSLAGYWLLDECSDNSTKDANFTKQFLSTGLKLWIVSANYFMWAFGVHGTMFYVGSMHTQLVLRIGKYLNRFQQDFSQKKKWAAVMYRKIQILTTLNNEVFQVPLLTIVLSNISAISFCLTGLVRIEWKQENIAALLVFTTIYVDAVMGHIVMTSALKRNGSRVQSIEDGDLQTKKGVASRIESKTKVGSNNYLEESTPLHLMDAAVGFAVQLLLLDA